MASDNREKTLADLEAKINDVQTITISVKSARFLAGIFIVALFGSNGISGSGIWRAGKFTPEDFVEKMKPHLAEQRRIDNIQQRMDERMKTVEEYIERHRWQKP